MKATYTDFLAANPPCTKFSSDPDAMAVFDLLSLDASIIAMIDASEAGKPALAPVVDLVESYYDTHKPCDFDFTKPFPKTVVGCMVKSILEPFGYEVEIQRDLPKAYKRKYFTSASCYRYNAAASATMKIARAVVPV